MSKPFDATLKELIEAYPQDWLRQLGLSSTGAIRVIDADVSTVSAQADRVILIEDPIPWLLNLELQSGRAVDLIERLVQYSGSLIRRHGIPVHTVVVLLRPEADSTALTGIARFEPPHGRSYHELKYRVVRLWREPMEFLLEGGRGTLPLAPLCAVPAASLPRIIRRMDERMSQEADSSDAAVLWTATYILMGLRYPPEFAAQLLQGVVAMRESTTYQAILEEGRQEGRQEGASAEARKFLLLIGTSRFGAPEAAIRQRIEVESGAERLEELALKTLQVSSWEELLS